MADAPVRVMIAADKAYLRRAPTTLASLRAATSGPIEVGVVMSGMSEAHQAIFSAACPGLDITFYDLGDAVPATMATRFYLSPFAFARIFMPTLNDWPRFLYLDIDMTVLQDVRPLYEMEMEGAPLAAVQTGGELNSGMLLVDADAWRAEGATAAIMDYAVTHRPYNADQDSIAAIMDDRTKWIDEKWNYCVTPLWVDQNQFDQAALDRAGIAHFITGFKPWNLGRLVIAPLFLAAWDRHRTPCALPRDWRHEARILSWQIPHLARHAVKRIFGKR